MDSFATSTWVVSYIAGHRTEWAWLVDSGNHRKESISTLSTSKTGREKKKWNKGARGLLQKHHQQRKLLSLTNLLKCNTPWCNGNKRFVPRSQIAVTKNWNVYQPEHVWNRLACNLELEKLQPMPELRSTAFVPACTNSGVISSSKHFLLEEKEFLNAEFDSKPALLVDNPVLDPPTKIWWI